MDVRFSLDGSSDDQLRSLYRWLRADDISGSVALSTPACAPRPGEMGGVVEFVNAVVSNGIALGGLLLAVAAWRESRRRAPAVRIERGDIVVLLNDNSPESVQRIVEALDATDPDTPAQ